MMMSSANGLPFSSTATSIASRKLDGLLRTVGIGLKAGARVVHEAAEPCADILQCALESPVGGQTGQYRQMGNNGKETAA